jgi:hypothetical protein
MRELYLDSKQILFLLSPFILLALLYGFPRYSAALVDTLEDLASKASLYSFANYEQMGKEGFEKGYYKDSSTIIPNFEKHDKSIYTQDYMATSWTIAYFYKELPKDSFLEEAKNGKNQIIKLQQLQEIVDQRNKRIKENLAIDGMVTDSQEIHLIKEIIKSRNLAPLLTDEMKQKLNEKDIPLDLAKYKLQMILWGTNNPTVIVNNKIYTTGQEVDLNTKIKQIKKEKILLKNLKEEKWLHLNK